MSDIPITLKEFFKMPTIVFCSFSNSNAKASLVPLGK